MVSISTTLAITEDLLHLATEKLKSVKRITTITELVVVWSVRVFVVPVHVQ